MFNLNVTEHDRKVYETELKNFLPKKIIDFHIHINKKEFESWGAHNGGSTWTDLVADEMTAEHLLDAFRQLLPENEVTPLVFGGCLCDIDTVNDYVRDKSREFGFPTLYRTSYDMPADQLEERIKAGGFLGIKPYLSNCPPYLPSKEVRIYDFLPKEHLEVADRNGLIVMLHIPRDGRLKDPVNLAQLLEIEENYPNLKLIVAHIGRAYSKEDIGNAFDILGKTKNMYFDFTANLSDDAIRACIEAVGTKRLIFGSDLPIAIMRMYRITENGVYYNVVPRGLYGDVDGEPHMRESDEEDITLMYYEQLLAMKRVAADLNLSDSDIEDIFYGNAKRLLDDMNFSL
ncbi:MAG: amidohydrolase family protein [Clostridia bacterium]|nr:amidohydrolase family protein [Clostridia bacterium]